MAQLPPKIPPPSNFTSTTTSDKQQLPSWVDEFLDFSSSRRGCHRRSASDSVAFLEECRFSDDGAATARTTAHAFHGLEDDQLMSMFCDDIALPQTPSSPSEQNSNNNEKPMALDVVVSMQYLINQPKNEACEMESSCQSDSATPPSPTPTSTETILDPKRVKRVLANRQSAQRSRVRKLQYISELERSVTSLQSEVSALSPRVAFLDHQRLILNVDNSTLKQRIAALAQDKLFKDARQEALKKEIDRLRQIYHQQNQQKMGNMVNNNGNSIHSPSPSQPQPSLPPFSASAANNISALRM
ncbi:basic leucine zipper 61-like [Gastrolobium bilobum]|uniref:basic leucine zipper 61-like n=1 Tax=Gastrolobium bilobum TaxID=150636 RepID=UPI002AB0311A|nr:basic leucine zipper 61-like [Gastrolobium bilobum]